MSRFSELKAMTDHPEYDQIFEAAVSRKTRIEIAKEAEHITSSRKRRVEDNAKQLMKQLRRDDPSQYNDFVKEMLDTEAIWSRHDLRFGTGWPVYNYIYAYKDLKGLPIALAEADLGFCFCVYLKRQSSGQV